MESYNKKACRLTKILLYIGIAVTFMCGIIFFVGDKVISGILLALTAIFLLLPVQQRNLRRLRVIFVCAVVAFVLWNISTTDLPPNSASSGIRFFDQFIHIVEGFTEGRFFKSR